MGATGTLGACSAWSGACSRAIMFSTQYRLVGGNTSNPLPRAGKAAGHTCVSCGSTNPRPTSRPCYVAHVWQPRTWVYASFCEILEHRSTTVQDTGFRTSDMFTIGLDLEMAAHPGVARCT